MQSQPSQAFKAIEGDVTEVLKTLPANFFDAVLSDPPYGISFMGKEWDRGVPSAATYRELARVLKPGAFGLHFGGTRMWHRLAVNLEDAGFQLRDTVMWLYGSGFPKSHNISKAIDKAAGAEREVVGRNPNSRENCDKSNTIYESGTVGKTDYITAPATAAAIHWNGYGTALKPAWEPALLVQKPLDKTFANNALAHGCGGLNIEGCRVCTESVTVRGGDENTAPFFGGGFKPVNIEHEGRFPANLILDEEAGEALDEQTGDRPAGNYPAARGTSHIGFASGQETEGGARKMTDKGGASRFFYCAKVSTKERNAGLADFSDKVGGAMQGTADGTLLTGSGNERNNTHKNNHPTLKPIALTTYLAKLLLVPARADGQPRRILVPFSGAGSEMVGCLLAGWDEVWGIELDGAYAKIAEARVKHHCPGSEVLKSQPSSFSWEV